MLSRGEYGGSNSFSLKELAEFMNSRRLPFFFFLFEGARFFFSASPSLEPRFLWLPLSLAHAAPSLSLSSLSLRTPQAPGSFGIKKQGLSNKRVKENKEGSSFSFFSESALSFPRFPLPSLSLSLAFRFFPLSLASHFLLLLVLLLLLLTTTILTPDPRRPAPSASGRRRTSRRSRPRPSPCAAGS